MSSSFEAEIAIVNLVGYRFPGFDQVSEKLIQAGGRTVHSEIHEFINAIWKKEEFPYIGRSQSLYLFIIRVKKHHSNYQGISLLLIMHNVFRAFFSQG